MRNAFIDTVLASVEDHPELLVISGDAGLGVFDDFSVAHPERFLNLGVAEQNTIGMAAGLALSGRKVVVYNIIPFVLYRCYEQVRNDICYQELPVILVGIGSGLTYSPQGMTHYSVEDLGVARTMPNLTVISPCDPVEARAAARYALDAQEPVYVRLAKRGEPDIHEAELDGITRPLVVADGTDAVIVFHGSVATDVLDARALLEVDGIRPKIVSLPMVQPLPVEEMFAEFDGFSAVFTVEEHFTDSGLGARLALESADSRPRWTLHRLGVPPHFIHDVLDQAGMRDHFGISASRIAESVKEVIARG